jgi:hypothetical protein
MKPSPHSSSVDLLTADLGGTGTRSAVAAAIRDDVARRLAH